MMDSKAYTEVYNIINCMSDEYKEKIPNKVIQTIKYKMDKNYEFNIDLDNINDLELMDDTEKILSVLYTDYISPEEERKIIKNKEKIVYLNKENKKKEKFESDIFKNNLTKSLVEDSNEKRENNKKETLINTKKEKWYKKLLNFIKRLLKN